MEHRNDPHPLLVVGDDALHRAVMRDMLQADGWRVLEATGVAQAREVLANSDPSVVLTDLHMPDGGGLEVCRMATLRGPGRPHTVIVSADEATRVIAAALDAGADDYLRKPVVRAELLARVRVGVRSHAARRDAERLALEARAREQEAVSILDAMTEGLMVAGADGIVRSANPALCRILGLPAHGIVGSAPPYAWWPQEERGAVEHRLRDVRAGIRGEIETVFVHPDGRRFPVQMTISPMRGRDGDVRGYVATVRDLSAHRRLERRLRASQAEHAALRRVAEAVARDMPRHQLYQLIAAEVAGVLQAECGLVARFQGDTALVEGGIGDDPHHRIGAVLPAVGDGALGRVAATGRPVRVVYADLPPDAPMRRIADEGGFTGSVAAPVRVGRVVWGAVLASTQGPGGIEAGEESRLGAFGELLALAIANAETQAQLVADATTDPLTGLANRRVLDERLSEELASCDHSGAPLCVVIIDLDHFKRVNDTHGHPVGDRVLAHVASLIQEGTRGDDMVARIGGEEFAWVLPNCRLEEALQAAERVRLRVEGRPIAPLDHITCSVGVAQWDGEEPADRLVMRADEALYAAKRGGRNAVRCATV